MAKNGSKNGTRDHTPEDYKGVLDEAEAKKRVKRTKRGNMEKGVSLNPAGRPKGSFSLRTMLRKCLQELRGNKTKAYLLVSAMTDAAISGDRNFNMAPGKLIMDHLEGTPHQTIVADVTNRDGYADLPDDELLRIAGLVPLEDKPAKPAKPRKKKAADDGS